MFVSGLPLRGAIARGEYFERKTNWGAIWAGKPIAEAHRWAESLGASACVAAKSAECLFQESPGWFSKQPVRMRNKDKCQPEQMECQVLKYVKVFDLEQIKSEFSKHGKNADSEEVKLKVHSTWELMKAVGTVSNHEGGNSPSESA
jgi:hypothetical protein